MLSKETRNNSFLFVCTLVGVIFGLAVMSSYENKTDFGDAALGKGTVSYFHKDKSGNSIHFLPKNSYNDFLNGLSIYSSYPKILFLGNSQSHSINQKELNDNTLTGYLYESFISDSILFFASSIPNANLQEHYLLSQFFFDSISNIETLLLPVFFDDFREDGIRESYFGDFSKSLYQIAENNSLAKRINSKLEIWQQKIKSNSNDTTASIENNDFTALNKTTQDVVERKLNDVLYRKFNFWQNRQQIRGEFFTTLYLSRNTAFGISAQTTRKKITSRYLKNKEALSLIINSCKKRDINLILIIPPLRTDIKYPYDESEYSQFKEYVNSFTLNGIHVLDLEDIVEPEYWGYSSPTQLFQTKDYDFMHFQVEGHKVFADTILDVSQNLNNDI